jgi:hypothetical protein
MSSKAAGAAKMIAPLLLCPDDSIRIYTSSFQSNDLILSQTVSLNDPASLQRIVIPCRAFDCSHLQCFDYGVLLSMNKDNITDKSFLKCPICNERRNPEKIYIDFVTLNLLKAYDLSDSVKLYRNGTFQVYSGPLCIGLSSKFNSFVIDSIYDLKQLGKG